MRSTALIGLGALVGFCATYAITGYAIGDWNAWNWDAFTRFLQATVGLYFGGLVALWRTP